jgi:hypothetical protein
LSSHRQKRPIVVGNEFDRLDHRRSRLSVRSAAGAPILGCGRSGRPRAQRRGWSSSCPRTGRR